MHTKVRLILEVYSIYMIYRTAIDQIYLKQLWDEAAYGYKYSNIVKCFTCLFLFIFYLRLIKLFIGTWY